MGWAKYSEDIEKIRDDTFNGKYKGFIFKSKTSRKVYEENLRKNNELIRQNEKLDNFQEVLDIKTSIIHIQVWIDFFQEVSSNIQNRKLIEYVEFRLDELEDSKDNYYEKYFDKKFQLIRDKVKVDTKKIEEEFLELIKRDFLEVFASIFVTLRNRTMEESIELRSFYMDLEDYVLKFMDGRIDDSFIENTLKLIYGDFEERICAKCKNSTYKEAYICISCDSDKGE